MKQQIIELYKQGLNYSQIARELDCTPQFARNIVIRKITKLSDCISVELVDYKDNTSIALDIARVFLKSDCKGRLKVPKKCLTRINHIVEVINRHPMFNIEVVRGA